MKYIYLLLFALLCQNLLAQNAFKGKWYNKEFEDDLEDVILKVGNTTFFDVVSNQLGLECKNVFKKDTLYLYVIGSDQGRGFMGPEFYPPKPKSLFAKCFVRGNQLYIYYSQKKFRDNIAALKLYTVLYKH